MQGFLHCVWPPRMHFELYFYSKNAHNSAENDRTGKIFHLVLKTTYKKLFLKYQVNTRFSSLRLASGNAIFGGRRKPRRRRKKKVGNPIGDPVRGRDAPIVLILKCRTLYLECVVFQDRWSVTAVVSQDRFYCT